MSQLIICAFTHLFSSSTEGGIGDRGKQLVFFERKQSDFVLIFFQIVFDLWLRSLEIFLFVFICFFQSQGSCLRYTRGLSQRDKEEAKKIDERCSIFLKNRWWFLKFENKSTLVVNAAFSGAIGLNNEQRVAIKAGLFVLVALQNRNPHDF